MANILIVEDEAAIAEIVSFNLEKQGHTVTAAYDGGEGLSQALSGDFDLILLDVMLPTMDGFSICREVRAVSEVPIVMLTAREEEADKVFGLELGADDYITKPFSMRELMARVQANLRHSPVRTEHTQAPDISQGDITIDFASHDVRRRGVSVELSAREYELLKCMAAQPGRIYSREELLSGVWGYDYFGDLRAVDVAMRRLREKLEEDSANPRYIMTKRGAGYFFAPQNAL